MKTKLFILHFFFLFYFPIDAIAFILGYSVGGGYQFENNPINNNGYGISGFEYIQPFGGSSGFEVVINPSMDFKERFLTTISFGYRNYLGYYPPNINSKGSRFSFISILPGILIFVNNKGGEEDLLYGVKIKFGMEKLYKNSQYGNCLFPIIKSTVIHNISFWAEGYYSKTNRSIFRLGVSIFTGNVF